MPHINKTRRICPESLNVNKSEISKLSWMIYNAMRKKKQDEMRRAINQIQLEIWRWTNAQYVEEAVHKPVYEAQPHLYNSSEQTANNRRRWFAMKAINARY